MSMLEAVLRAFNPPHLLASGDIKKTLKKGGKVAKQAQQDLLAAAIWLSLKTFIHDLYKKIDPSVPDLSRHATQHGRKEPPNEKIEVLRLLHALEAALSLHQEMGVSIRPRLPAEKKN